MDTLKSLTRRVAVAGDVQGIVRTMKSLSAASIRQYEQAVESLSDYNKALRLGFRILFHPHNGGTSDLTRLELTPRNAQPLRFGAIVFGSDQGLCGRFNETIADFAADQMRAINPALESWSVISVGNRVNGQLLEHGFRCPIHETCPRSVIGITPFTQGLLPQVQSWHDEQQLDQVFVFHNKRVSSSTCRPRRVRLLPPDLLHLTTPREDDGNFHTLPTFRADRVELLRKLITQYLFVTLFRACAESLSSENASRIASMQSAEKTIEDRLAKLTSQLNEQRQNAITEELLDIVTGYEASRT